MLIQLFLGMELTFRLVITCNEFNAMLFIFIEELLHFAVVIFAHDLTEVA